MNKSDLNDVHVNESQVIGNSLIDSHESDGEDNQVNYRFKKSEGYHAVPLLYTRNYMPPRADLSFAGLDDSVTSVNKTKISTSMTSKESLEKPKSGRPSAPIIEEWESDSKDENVVEKIKVKKTVKPSLEKIEFINARNITVENESKAEKPRKLRRSPKVNTARPKAVTNAVRMNRVNDVKASSCWVWKPIKPNSASITLKRYDYVDVRGKSRSVMAWVPKKVKKHIMKLLEWNLHVINVSSAGPAPYLKWSMGIKCSKAFPLLAMKIPLLEHFATYLQNKHYALWEVIEFGDSYKAPPEETGKGPASESSTKKKGRTVVITKEDMQKRRNDVTVRTTLLLALPDEHQFRFSKYEIAQELWEGILKTFGGNEATKKTKKNQLKQQYGNFKAEGSETLKQTFNRLQAIVSHLEFMDVEIEQNDLNQKFLRSLAPEWLMYTIVWRNKDDRDTMSLDDVYYHLKVYEPEVQKNSESNSQNMAFISSSNTSSGKGKVHTIDEDDIKEIDIKWNMALLSMRADRFWKKTGKKITIQGSDVASFDKSKDWSYMANEEENHALVADDEVLTEFSLMAKSSSSLENEKEKEGLDNKLIGFEKASKDLDNLLGSQRSDKNKEGLGYSAVLPPAQVYSPLKKDLSWTYLPGFVDDTVTDYSRPTPSINELIYNTSDLQSNNFFVFEHGESSGSIMSKPMIKFVKAVDCPRVTKTNNTENARKSTVKYAEMYRNTSKSPKVRVKTQPRVLRVSTVTGKIPTVDSKFSTAKSMFTADLGNKGKAVKASACWIWRPKQNNTEQGLNCNSVSVTFKKYQYIDTQGRVNGCSRHMTGNISYLSEYEPYDGGYVLFGQGGGRITGKGIIKTDLKVKIIRCDNRGEFKNKEMNELCTKKGIRREFSNARTPQQNRVSEKRNRTLIEAARTMLADAKLPVTFWAKVVNTACYVQNMVEENLHVDFLENKLIKKGAGLNWLFNINTLTNSMNYVPVVVAGTFSTNILGTKDVASQAVKKDVSFLIYIALPNWFHEAHMEFSNSDAQDDCNTNVLDSSGISNPTTTSKVPLAEQVEPTASLTVETKISTVSSPVPTVCLGTSPGSSRDPRIISKEVFSHKETPSLGNALTLSNRFEDTSREEADLSNMETSIPVSPTSTFRIHKDHPKSQIIGPVDTPVQTRHKSKEMEEQSFIAIIHHKTNLELLQFWVRPIGTKWVLKNKKDEQGIVIRNKARIKAILLFLAHASFMGFTVYQMDVKSSFLYGTIDEEVYVMQPPGFQDLEFPDRVYKVEKAMYGLHLVPRAWYDSDYGGATQDRKSTNGGCQFLGRRLISWQCKKQSIVATSTTKVEYVAAASGCGQVLWIQNQLLDYGNSIMVKLAFCDYHNMIAILERTEHNIGFHQIVDFLEASHIRVKTMSLETKILATIDGKPRTISESSLRRHLRLNDEEGISSLPDIELFENLSLMCYNILPNQRFTFQKGQFSHQWKFCIHTIMQCLSSKSTGFNEFSSNITIDVGEGSAIPTEPQHTPSPQEQHSSHHDPSSPSHPTTSIAPITPTPNETPTETATLRRYTGRATQIA
nr:hypothetical protein [Tanacetum cinerariifolium]